MTIAPAYRHVRDWVFDLDNTLYPAASSIFEVVETRMTDYIVRELAMERDAAAALREHYYHQYGATVAGLARHHAIDGGDFLAHTHDVEPDMLVADPELNALIAALPGRRIVCTNAGGRYAERLLEKLELTALFDSVCHIEGANFSAKPERAAYESLVAQTGLEPRTSLLIEDTLRNLEPAHDMGFTTVLVGVVHPAPLPDYVNAYAHDLKAFLKSALSL